MPTFTTESQPEMTGEVKYSNADYAFANKIINTIKRAHRLPLMISANDVFNAIEVEAPSWYANYPDATQDDQLVFDVSVLSNPQKYLDAAGADKSFRLQTNQVLMPPAVYGIYNVFYTGGSAYANRSLLNYANWSLSWLLLSSAFGAYPRMAVDNYMGSVFCMNLLRSLSKEPVRHYYNQDSHILQVYDLGARSGSICCEVSRCLQIQNFYQNPWFIKLIIASTIEARCTQIDLFGAQLPGDLQINTGVLRDIASKYREEVDKHLEAENGSDFYAIKS